MRALLVGLSALLTLACFPAEWGASAVLEPSRRAKPTTGVPHEDLTFRTADGLSLHGWLFRTQAARRGLIVYLHGIADNRRGSAGLAQRFGPRGYDLLAYDGRAHGDSQGRYCTYGYLEKRDLQAALDAVQAPRAILFGSSLGAAVALQAAAVERRVEAVIAQSPFADLESIAHERAPLVATWAEVDRALALAGQRAGFPVSAVSPAAEAVRLTVPVLLVHGERDRETRPEHSERIYARLRGPRRLLLVPGAGHNDVLAGEAVWSEIEGWLDRLPGYGVSSTK